MIVKFIADIGANHNGSFQRLYDLTLSAGDMGCWAIKPQFYDADKLFRGKSPIPKEWEFKYEWFSELKKLCTHLGLQLGVSVFDSKSVEMVKPYADFLKISSFDAMRFDLIDACLKTEKSIFISVGLLTEKELAFLAKRYWNKTKQIDLFYCISEYPAKVSHCNLKKFDYKGYSDHTKSPGVIHRVVAQGAEYIEFHMDLDNFGWEQQLDNACWLPKDMAPTIFEVRLGEAAMEPYEFPPEHYLKKADPKDGLRPMIRS